MITQVSITSIEILFTTVKKKKASAPTSSQADGGPTGLETAKTGESDRVRSLSCLMRRVLGLVLQDYCYKRSLVVSGVYAELCFQEG